MPRLTLPRVLTAALFLCLVASLDAGDNVKKQPVPDKKALAKADDLVNDIFKDEIKAAKDPEARVKLATYLMQQGDESGDDPAARYVLYRWTRDLAVQAGDPKLALGAIDKLATYFEVPAFDLKADALAKLAPNVPTKEPSKALTEMTLDLITEALEADNYDAAVALGKVATEAAKRSQVVALVTSVAKRSEEIAVAREKFSKLQPYVDRLKQDPNDAEANLKLGEYFGLIKGKWDRALPLLARSKSEPLADLARQDLANPKEARDQLALADAWWDHAAKQPEATQLRLQERAVYWYDKALPGLKGLSYTKAQKRIEQVEARTQGTRPAVEGPVGEIKKLDGHNNEIRAVALSPDHKLALTGSVDNTMKLWDLKTGKEIQQFKGHTKQVWDVAFVPNSKHVLSASWDATVKLWDTTTGKDVRTYSHPLDVNAVTVSKDGKWMLTGSDDRHMRLWDLAKHEEVRKFPPHTDFCYACAFAPDGIHCASGSKDRRAVVYELKTGKVVKDFEQNNNVVAVAFSPDSRYLFTCGDNAVYQWEIATGKKVKSFEGTGSYALNGMALTPDGRRLLAGGEDKILHLWDVATAKEIQQFKGSNSTITAVAMTADGRRGLTGQVDGGVRYWGLPAR
jgi:WD40 repeat protein